MDVGHEPTDGLTLFRLTGEVGGGGGGGEEGGGGEGRARGRGRVRGGGGDIMKYEAHPMQGET